MTTPAGALHAPLDSAAALRSAGLRVTAQRTAVLDALAAQPHASAEALHADIRARVPGIALPTVHNIVNDLSEAGIVRRVSLPDVGSALYEIDFADNHHHVQCVECGRVEDVDCAVGSAPCLHPSHDHGMRIIEAAVTYRAICSACERTHNDR